MSLEQAIPALFVCKKIVFIANFFANKESKNSLLFLCQLSKVKGEIDMRLLDNASLLVKTRKQENDIKKSYECYQRLEYRR